MTAEEPSDTSELQFVDTNVLVYAHDRSAGRRHEVARSLLEDLWDSGNGCLSIQVLQEYHVTVTRKVARPMSTHESARVISGLSNWRVYAPQVQDVVAAIQLQVQFQISFWDAMIVQSAMRLGCGILWSEDFTAGQRYGITQVRNPFV